MRRSSAGYSELVAVSYVGIPLAGKTTSIYALAHLLRETRVCWRPRFTERELFLEGTHPTRADLRLHVSTIPGAAWCLGSWKLQIVMADAIIVVADAQPERNDQQSEFLRELEDTIVAGRLEPSAFPVVVQVNKQDLRPKDAASFQANVGGVARPHFVSNALRREGIWDPFNAAVAAVLSARDATQLSHPGDVALRMREWLPFAARRPTTG